MTATLPMALPKTDRVEVRQSALGGSGVFATRPIVAGEVVIELSPVFRDDPERYSVQVGPDRHQAFTNEPDDYLNHGCRPNVRVEPDLMHVVALRDINLAEEIRFNYNTSEWELAEPFLCTCDGRPSWIAGFAHLHPAEQAALHPLLPAWLVERVA